jgi:uracil-DNA glycosylase
MLQDLCRNSVWKEVLQDEFSAEYFSVLSDFVEKEYQHHEVYPPRECIFTALDACSFDEVRVVILGQDPYHAHGQAHGMAFSVPDQVPIPPSLKNIYRELHTDVGIEVPESGNLSRWAQQGVLLLNTTLTVRAGQPGSHTEMGWEKFTDKIITRIAEQHTHCVFLLWGAHAGKKRVCIPTSSPLVLTAPHPSPLSAYRGFFGCRHFSITNAYLRTHGLREIKW